MALPPTIPSSFVPHPGNMPPSRLRVEPTTLLNILPYVLLGIMGALALGVFAYGHLLTSTRATKEAELAAAQKAIDPTTIESFVRLHNRLQSSKALLSAHPALSKLFSSFEKITPIKTRFTSLHFTMQEDGSARIDGTGVAQSFNVLAATSHTFASDSRIKNVVFSNIRAGRDGSVAFALSAKVEGKDVTFDLAETTASTPPLP